MSIVTERAPTSDGGGEAVSGRGGRRARRRAALLLVVAMFACVAWWDTHPHVFSGFGNGVGITNRPGEPALIVLSWPGSDVIGSHDVHILAVSPHVRSAPPDTSIRTVWCARRWSDGALTTDRVSLQAACLRSRPALGATLRVAHHSGDQLVLEVRRTKPGTVVIDGATVTYRSGLRFGRQHIGVVATATFSASAAD